MSINTSDILVRKTRKRKSRKVAGSKFPMRVRVQALIMEPGGKTGAPLMTTSSIMCRNQAALDHLNELIDNLLAGIDGLTVVKSGEGKAAA